MDDKTVKIIENVENEISKIDKKENKIFFFVVDTKGSPSGSLEYIYNLALILKEDGYDVNMLHTDKEFVGVGAWLGEEYTNLPHFNVNDGEISTSPSDILFIPEIYSQVMNQTKSLPCKRIAILQNYDYVVEQMPYVAQWGDFGIMDCITNSDYQGKELNKSFPYVKMKKITPYISDIFGEYMEQPPRKMVVNIITKDPSISKKIVKPFYWKYPLFKWVSFKGVKNLPKTGFAEELRDAAVTIVVDDDTSFGYSALEAMKSGSIVMMKVPQTGLDWAASDDNALPNCCIWFNDYDTLHRQLVSVVRAYLTDNVPQTLKDESDEILSKLTKENTAKEFREYIAKIQTKRKEEMLSLIESVKNKDKEVKTQE